MSDKQKLAIKGPCVIDKDRILFLIHKMRGQAMGAGRSADRDMDMGRLEASVESCTSEIVRLLG